LDFVLLLAAVIALALPLSALSHRFVELPAIRAGNRLAARIAGWQHVRFTPSAAGKESGSR
jgi:peptidoglycan/LPS O-acetylase OafA/YrhL